MDQAVKHFMGALKNPLYSTPEKPYNNNAGICVLSRGDYKSAEEFFQKALSLRPADSQALIGMVEVNFRSGNLAAAKSNLSRYMQVSAPAAESLWLGIQIERKTGDRHAGASYTMQLQKRFPDSREAAALRDGRFE
jgi:type IV pilus assembly protein PilF